MRISVVIPTFRRADNLRRCLEGLEQQRRPPDQVLVAVRSDDPATRKLVTAYDRGALAIEEVDVGEAGASEARNRCLDRAQGDVLVMTDDDTVPRADWLELIHDRFAADRELGALGGPDWTGGLEVPPDHRATVVGKVQWWGRRVGNHHCGSRRPLAVEWLKGANMSFRREALRGTRFGRLLRGPGAQFAEDVAVPLYVRRSGWKVLYDPAICVDHYSGRLMAGVDHRALRDSASLADACHNETVALLDYLPAPRRAVFLAWSVLVGTRLLPGALMVGYLLLSRWQLGAFRRFLIGLRGRLEGWKTWSRRERQPATGVRLSPSSSTAAVITEPARTRVCLVTHVVAPWDGQGRVMFELARYLAQRGHQVTLVAALVDPLLRGEAGITWIKIPVPARLPNFLRWLILALQVRLKLGARAHRRFDIVHLNGAIAPVRADVNTSHFVHATWGRLSKTWARSSPVPFHQRLVTTICAACERRAYRHARRVVAVSDTVHGALLADVGLPPAGLDVVYLGVDAREFRPRETGDPRVVREAVSLGEHAFVVLFVGDAKSPRKNLDLAIEAVSRLSDRFHLVVVGEARGGPYHAMAQRLGVSARTHFLGMRLDVADCLRDADAVYCASRYEPASLVLLEALATGVPVITGAEVGNAAFLEHGRNGFLVRSTTDVEGTVAILEALGNDPELGARIGRCARQTAERLSWDRMGHRYEQIYLDLVAERRGIPAKRVETAIPTAMPIAVGRGS